MADGSGAVTLARSYTPFGGLLTSAGSGASPYGFSGEASDPSGLIYLRARYYDPQAGRFLNRDSFAGFITRPASLHRFTYAENNPVRFGDPAGHDVGCGGRDLGECVGQISPSGQLPILTIVDYKGKSSDSKFLSSGVLAGGGGFFLSAGADIIWTDKEMGIFTTLALGPGLGGDTAAVVSRELEDRTGIWPQMSSGFVFGDLYGNSIKENIKNYSGTSLVIGASYSLVTNPSCYLVI